MDCNGEKRRSSSRIQKLKSEKALIVCPKETVEPPPVSRKSVKRIKVEEKPNLGSEVIENGDSDSGIEMVADSNERKASVEGGEMVEVAEKGTGSGEKSAYARVTQTIRAFNKHYLHFVQEEEKRYEQVKADNKKAKSPKKVVTNGKEAKSPNNKKRDVPEDKGKNPSKRPDLKAITKMMETKSILYHKKRIGSIPGVDVGHQFFSRAEMVAVGFHGHWLNGIDYVGQSGRKDFNDYRLPLTVSIVLSGQYEDDLDNCEDIVYTGQGGNDLLGNKRQICDQVMKRGNLGLKNCMEQCVPVRVVRGHQSKISYVGKVYTYDGLYKVVNYWADKGVSGFTVYKYRLKRLEGQPSLTTTQVYFSRGQIPTSVSEIRGLVCEDISGGLEDIPIPATNLVDDPPVAPTGFIYRNKTKVSKSVKQPVKAPGCDCEGNCVDAKKCACAQLNGSDFPYVHRDGGRLIEPMAVVFECGPNCGCGPGCVNRTSQRGLRYRLEVFRTPNKGWAVRSWDYIPSGAPICEYFGNLIRTDDVDAHDPENQYIFDIDCLQTMKGLDGRERRLRDVSLPSHLMKGEDDKDSAPEFCLDAGLNGGVARFLNHSCQPNVFIQCVLSTHHDPKQARVVLFAADNIPPLKELTYDYGYALDSVVGPDGKIKQLLCFCGAADCRKRMF